MSWGRGVSSSGGQEHDGSVLPALTPAQTEVYATGAYVLGPWSEF